MKILIIISLLFGGHFAHSQTSIRAFSVIDKSYSKVNGELEIKNMPRVASQDGLGICYAYVAATQLQAENCRVLKKDCSSLSEEELFSPLDIARIKTPENDQFQAQLRSSYAGLNTESGGDPHTTAVIAGLVVKKTANEACISLDKVLSKMNSRGETIEAQAAMWERMKKHYFNYQKKKKCADCLSDVYATAKNDIDENLNLTTSNEEVLKAFGEDTYEKFLDQLLGANKCRRPSQLAVFENADNLEYKFYPEANEKDPKKLKDAFSPDKFKGKIKEVLKTGRPLSLGNICVGEEPAQNCKPQNNHAVVISGYRQICNQAGKCRESLRVVNSWGKSWQDQNDGGWVDADTLISSIKVSPQVLGYFADKK
ncbi:hypothetical protein [Bdellovibrio bacteriovorus]|uniref:hypothetical protein n=1 Tax=Bdellovibrio bacteriovorus TaxID=959 RepID=UPI0035A5E894